MRKKRIIGMLCIVGALIITGCSGKTNTTKQTTEQETTKEIAAELMKVGQPYKPDNKASITITKIQTVENVEPLLGNRDYVYMKNPGKIKLDVVLDVENLSGKDQSASELLKVIATDLAKSKEYKCDKIETEINNNSKLSADEKIKAGKTALVHCQISVPEGDNKYMIYIGEEKAFQIEYDTTTVVNNNNKLKTDKKIIQKGFSEVTLKKVYYAKELKPKNPSGLYNYLKSKKKDGILLIAQFELTNKSGKDKQINELLMLSKQYKSGEANIFQPAADKSDGTNLSISMTATSSPTIKAGETLTVYCVLDQDKSYKKADTDIFIAVKGAEYTYTKKASK